MVAKARTRRPAKQLRFQQPPWGTDHPDWLKLDAELPEDHPARLIDRLVNALDLTPYLSRLCAGFGSEAYQPHLLLKLVLYELDRRVLSPAQWWRDCTDLKSLQWLLRGCTPARSTLYDFRNRLSDDLLLAVNAQQLRLALLERLADCRRQALDGSFLASRASRHRLLRLQRLDQRLELLQTFLQADKAVAAGQPAADLPPCPAWLARTPQRRLRQSQGHLRARAVLLDKMSRHARRQQATARARRRDASRVVISVTDPEAALGLDKLKVFRPLYNVQLSCDLDSPFLAGYGVFAAVTDVGLLPPMLGRIETMSGRAPRPLLADGTYANVLDLRACQEPGVEVYAPVAQPGQQGQQPGSVASAGAEEKPTGAGRLGLPVLEAGPGGGPQRLYGKDEFVWQADTQTYRCPAGQTLRRVGTKKVQRRDGQQVEMHKYATAACRGCPQRGDCTRSVRGREIARVEGEECLEALKQRMQQEEAQALYKLRKQTVELGFADLKENRGCRSVAGFGLHQAQVLVGLLVLLHNGKALLRLRQRPAQQNPIE